jgi:hypothetical protein
MPVAQILLPKFVEHRLSPAVSDLIVQRSEVRTFTAHSGTNSERSVASFKATGWNNPAGFGEHYDAQQVAHLECVDAFALDGELGLSDHRLQSPDATLVATPIGFVCDE